jgi:M6 family metalloprotease-like protein
MRTITAVLVTALLLAGTSGAAPPLPGSGVPPLHEGPSSGVAVTGPAVSNVIDTDAEIRICFIRAQFLEDYTPTTTGNGLFDLEADPPHDRSYFENLGSQMAQYFSDVSSDSLVLTFEVYPAGLESSYQMPHQMAWYGDDERQMTGACELLRDAVLAADPDVDFSQFDAVIVFHAGAGQESDVLSNSPDDIHSVFLRLVDLQYYLPEGGSGYPGIPTGDGVYVTEGAINPEQESQDGYGFGVIGTIVHEFFHQLGLPDLYNTYDGTVGVGGWDIMGYGQWVMTGWWPTQPGAWCRSYLQWSPVAVIEDTGQFSVTAGDTIYRVPLSGTEYLLIENRQRDPDGDGMCGTSEHDWGLPGSGILIWHVDETRLGDHIQLNTVNVDPLHKGVDLEEADGIQDFDWGIPDIYGVEGSRYDPWFQGGVNWLFGPESEPSTETSWGGNTWVTVEVLDHPQNSMQVTVGRTGTVPGWPVRTDAVRWGPLLWNSQDGPKIVVTTTTGYTRAFEGDDGSGVVPMGIGVTAPPAAGNPAGGGEYLLVCEEDGEVHLRDTEWNEPSGWPARLPSPGVACLVSERAGLVAVATDDRRLYLIDGSGNVIDGWPVSLPAPVRGLCILPDQESLSVCAASADGSLYLYDLQGTLRQGWPVHPGDEAIGIPLSADIDRDGDCEVLCVSGGHVWSYGPDGEPEPGFPALLDSDPLGSLSLAALDVTGRLAVLVEVEEGISAVGASGAAVTDWPWHTPTDSLGFGFDRHSRGIGGDGFVLWGIRDGRICLVEETGSQPDIFPVSTGDDPVCSPVIWRLDSSEPWRVTAADAGGRIYSWYTSYEPEGWHTGMDRGGENCWWTDDLPPVGTPGGLIAPGSFFVYPNPVRTGQGTIRFQPGEDCSWVIRVFNVAGDLVTFTSGTAPGGAAWEVPWETGDFSPGVYYVNLEITSGQGTESSLFQAAVVN